jgi:hypothetical protein
VQLRIRNSRVPSVLGSDSCPDLISENVNSTRWLAQNCLTPQYLGADEPCDRLLEMPDLKELKQRGTDSSVFRPAGTESLSASGGSSIGVQ